MFKYKENVLELLRFEGYTRKYLRENKIIGEKSIQDMKNGIVVGIKSLDAICTLLRCQPGELIEWVPDAPQEAAGSHDTPTADTE